jgi:hypothetical protein
MSLVDVQTESGVQLARIVERRGRNYKVQFFSEETNDYKDEEHLINYDEIVSFYDEDSDSDYEPSESSESEYDSESLVDEEDDKENIDPDE